MFLRAALAFRGKRRLDVVYLVTDVVETYEALEDAKERSAKLWAAEVLRWTLIL